MNPNLIFLLFDGYQYIFNNYIDTYIIGSGGNVGSSGGKNVVRGYTKKGKLFLDFDTNLTESIKSISISGSHLLVAGDHVYNHYVDCRDSNYFLSEDSIFDVMALPGEKVTFKCANNIE